MRPDLLAPLHTLHARFKAASASAEGSRSSEPSGDTDEARIFRAELVRHVAKSVRDARVLEAIAGVPRQLFVPDVPVRQAYLDRPEPIGFGQTISQPTIVGIMAEALELSGRERVLEIGTGCGYQAAILSRLAADVYSVEIIPELADEASARLSRLGYDNVHLCLRDGTIGWEEEAPFDRIILAAAPEKVPPALFDQLRDGGIVVAPTGIVKDEQRLFRYRKTNGQVSSEDLGGVRFVPMVKCD
jgi:protein-L-isoaspartate(D-aspartate) O-methyltransferase